jgi:hypothetical protein
VIFAGGEFGGACGHCAYVARFATRQAAFEALDRHSSAHRRGLIGDYGLLGRLTVGLQCRWQPPFAPLMRAAIVDITPRSPGLQSVITVEPIDGSDRALRRMRAAETDFRLWALPL